MAEAVVQTRLPGEILDAVAHISSDEGESVAGWLRRLVFREVNLVRLKAWVVSARDVEPVEVFTSGGSNKYVLRPHREFTPLVRSFTLNDVLGAPIPTHVLIAQSWYKKPSQYRFVIDRSPVPWRIVALLGDEITLGAEPDLFKV